MHKGVHYIDWYSCGVYDCHSHDGGTSSTFIGTAKAIRGCAFLFLLCSYTLHLTGARLASDHVSRKCPHVWLVRSCYRDHMTCMIPSMICGS